jgi:hypothetical protein
MYKRKMIKLILFLFITTGMVSFFSTAIWAHGEETKITPDSLNVKAGSELKVTVNGLTGAKTAIFWLTGLMGKYELGEFPISSDDFTQLLQIPADLSPGSYRLTVEGGDKSAKVVINVN